MLLSVVHDDERGRMGVCVRGRCWRTAIASEATVPHTTPTSSLYLPLSFLSLSPSSSTTMATQAYIPQYDAYAYLQQEPPSPTPTVTMPLPVDSNAPRFSKLLNSVLGSPFLTTSDLPHNGEATSLRSVSMHTNDELETIDGAFSAVPRAHTVTRPTSPSPSFRTDTYSIVNWNEHMDVFSNDAGPSDTTPTGCAIGLRSSIWSSASATYFPYYTSTPYNTMRFIPNRRFIRRSLAPQPPFSLQCLHRRRRFAECVPQFRQ